jgi:hypothetical protein
MNNVLIKYYGGKSWMCEDTYESLVWNDTTMEKPTEEEINVKLGELRKEQMREERNELLKASDFRVLVDYNKDKDLWIQYRQALRDFPSSWVDGMPFPAPPP